MGAAFPIEHLGEFDGTNRLWLDQSQPPSRSVGSIQIEASSLSYRWSYEDGEILGEIKLRGPEPSLRVDWKDSFHAADGMVLHGSYGEGVLRAFGTYGDGEAEDWGWRVEIEFRDSEACQIRMFNVYPDGRLAMAVDLTGWRRGASS